MTKQKEIEDNLRLGRESRSFEVKGPGSLTDKHYVARVARAAMAMGNLRDGGLVCLGIDDNGMGDMRPGMTSSQLAEWDNFDNVKRPVGEV